MSESFDLTLLAVLVAAVVAHAVWNLVLKATHASGIRFVGLTIIVGVVALAPWGVDSSVRAIVEAPLAGLVIVASGAIHCGYFFLLQRAYGVADVSVVYPLARGTGPLLSVIGAILILGERPALATLLGASVVVAGVVVIGVVGSRQVPAVRGRSSSAEGESPSRARLLQNIL